jgi:pimeloyl-ACP methyl ester carboxylesterase
VFETGAGQVTISKEEKNMESKTNVVLVHGAWADASCWSKVIPLLQKQELNVTGVQLSLNTLEDDIAVTRHALASQHGPTVLVGHSYGGAVITGAANQAPNVTALVYIAAFGLDEGESLDSLSKQGPAPAGSAQIHPDDNGHLWIDRAGFYKAFVADAEPVEASVMAATQRPLGIAAFTTKSGPPAWQHLPSWYLISSDDQMIPPAAQELMAQRMDATMSSVPASHASMVSRPKEVSAIILQAVESTRSK